RDPGRAGGSVRRPCLVRAASRGPSWGFGSRTPGQNLGNLLERAHNLNWAKPEGAAGALDPSEGSGSGDAVQLASWPVRTTMSPAGTHWQRLSLIFHPFGPILTGQLTRPVATTHAMDLAAHTVSPT